ncbi:MAG: hypothetical protein IPI66_11060 [Chitinophagaceae bacterium]|nr:hypothetical protein [Chitinophagaceae bacterium]
MRPIINRILTLAVLTVCLVSCNREAGTKKIPDLKETYSSRDKKPFGAWVAYKQLGEMFYTNTLRTEKNNFTESWKRMDDTASLYIAIARSLFTTDTDVSGILEFASEGNAVFLSAGEIEDNLAEKLGCRIRSGINFASLLGKPFTTTNLKLNEVTRPGPFTYFYHPFIRYFSGYDSSRTRVLGVNESGDPNFIVIFKGKGKIFLHCEPRAFSNYFLLQEDNFRYLQQAFGYVSPEPDHIYWNDYYARLRNRSEADNKSSDEEGFSSLDEILSHPPLAAAFWLAIVLLLLYVLYTGKRRQRIIEEIKPNENTTVSFTETIGRLYLQKKDNKNIADKMITYFNEYIRNNYFLNTHAVNEDFVTTLSRKSGVPRDKIDSLYRAIGALQNSQQVDDFPAFITERTDSTRF